MTTRSGWFAPRITREHLDTLFSGWKARAWLELNAYADEAGQVRLTAREMVERWGTSNGGLERWLNDLVGAGYITTERPGSGPRSGRIIRVTHVLYWWRT